VNRVALKEVRGLIACGHNGKRLTQRSTWTCWSMDFKSL